MHLSFQHWVTCYEDEVKIKKEFIVYVLKEKFLRLK